MGNIEMLKPGDVLQIDERQYVVDRTWRQESGWAKGMCEGHRIVHTKQGDVKFFVTFDISEIIK